MRTCRPIQRCLLLGLCIALSCASPDGTARKAEHVRAPTVRHRVKPELPLELRRAGVSGVVVVSGTVPKEGGVLRNPRVVKSDDPRLNQPALDAVSRWIWTPGLQDGVPVDVEAPPADEVMEFPFGRTGSTGAGSAAA